MEAFGLSAEEDRKASAASDTDLAVALAEAGSPPRATGYSAGQHPYSPTWTVEGDFQ